LGNEMLQHTCAFSKQLGHADDDGSELAAFHHIYLCMLMIHQLLAMMALILFSARTFSRINLYRFIWPSLFGRTHHNLMLEPSGVYC